MFIQKIRYMQKLEFTNENHTIPDVILWRGRARYRPYFADMQDHQALREEIWPLPTTLQEKLYGPVDALRKTTRFVAETEIEV
jgi:hypothetical protein